MRLSALLAFVPLILSPNVFAHQTPHAVLPKPRPGLRVNLILQRSDYRLSDEIDYSILVTNISHGPLYIFDELGLDASDTVGLSVKNLTTGQRWDVWIGSDPVPPPPPPGKKSSFKKLLPHEIFGVNIKDTFDSLYIKNQGRYELTALFESPLTPKMEKSFHLPTWSKDKGLLHSDPFIITVTK